MVPLENGANDRDEKRLDALLRAYRAACPDQDPSVNFMPNLWQRIEARRSFTFSFRRMVSAFVTAAAAVTVALGVYLSMPHTKPNAGYTVSYLEALADANSVDSPEMVAPVRLDLDNPGR
jgi:hypothetical protein